MRILNSAIVTALVLPMALAASGVAAAGAAAGSSVLSSQITASDDDSDKCDEENDRFLGLLNGNGHSTLDEGDCFGEKEDDISPLG